MVAESVFLCERKDSSYQLPKKAYVMVASRVFKKLIPDITV
jgi:hypothetical protein